MAGVSLSFGPTTRTFRENLKRLREERGFGYAELARRLAAVGHPIPVLGLRNLEAGKRRADVDDLMALSKVLSTSPPILMLPPVRSADVMCEVTGFGNISTDLAWFMLGGSRGSGYPDEWRDHKDALYTIFEETPRRQLTRQQLLKRRRDIKRGKLTSWREDIKRGSSDPGLAKKLETLATKVAYLDTLDPASDEDWAILSRAMSVDEDVTDPDFEKPPEPQDDPPSKGKRSVRGSKDA